MKKKFLIGLALVGYGLIFANGERDPLLPYRSKQILSDSEGEEQEGGLWFGDKKRGSQLLEKQEHYESSPKFKIMCGAAGIIGLYGMYAWLTAQFQGYED